jgi:DNA-directed RNA polymerase specialized sigma24 family protein
MLDPLLRGFVDAADEAEAERRLATLLEEHAAPLIRKIVARKLGAHGGPAAPYDLEDIVADALLALVSRLQSLRQAATSDPIESFGDYTAVVAYNAFAYHLRRLDPGRSRLKNRLRYVLTREPRLGLWATPDGPVCGLAGWRPGSASPVATERLDGLMAEPERRLRWAQGRQASPTEPAALVGVFQAIGGPVELDRLVGTIAALSPVEEKTRDVSTPPSLADEASPPADVALDQRRMAERLWLEICALPQRQRVALLLNLRDVGGASLLWVFPLTGTASIRRIAGALEMPDLELAEIWNRLPLDDRTIAERLGCTRQQVINLRGAARKRLANRLEGRADGRPEANIRGGSDSLEDKA